MQHKSMCKGATAKTNKGIICPSVKDANENKKVELENREYI